MQIQLRQEKPRMRQLAPNYWECIRRIPGQPVFNVGTGKTAREAWDCAHPAPMRVAIGARAQAAYERATALYAECEAAGREGRDCPELALKTLREGGSRLFVDAYDVACRRRQNGCNSGCANNPCACARAAHTGSSPSTPFGDSTHKAP